MAAINFLPWRRWQRQRWRRIETCLWVLSLSVTLFLSGLWRLMVMREYHYNQSSYDQLRVVLTQNQEQLSKVYYEQQQKRLLLSHIIFYHQKNQDNQHYLAIIQSLWAVNQSLAVLAGIDLNGNEAIIQGWVRDSSVLKKLQQQWLAQPDIAHIYWQQFKYVPKLGKQQWFEGRVQLQDSKP